MTTFAGLTVVRMGLVAVKALILQRQEIWSSSYTVAPPAILGQLYPITSRGVHSTCGVGVDHPKRNTAKNGPRNMR